MRTPATGEDAIKYKNNVNEIHDAAENKCTVEFRLLTVYEYDPSTKKVVTSVMTFDHFKDLAHIIYGEGVGKDADKLAHLLLNREIKFAKLAELNSHTAIGIDQKTGKKIYPDETNSPLLKNIKKYGFIKYVIYATFKPYNQKALDEYKATIEDGKQLNDGGNLNTTYSDFAKYKNNIDNLNKNLKNVKKIFKSIIDARTGKTKDKNPNKDGWRGVNGVNQPRNDMPNVKSDPVKK